MKLIRIIYALWKAGRPYRIKFSIEMKRMLKKYLKIWWESERSFQSFVHTAHEYVEEREYFFECCFQQVVTDEKLRMLVNELCSMLGIKTAYSEI